jgi:cytochrome oxidase Cu insertion factor (SCO1/SenC/PrrC family)
MRHRFALLALLAALVLAAAGCGGDPPPDPPAAAPTTTTTPAPEPTTAPEPTRVTAARPAPSGVVPADQRQPAPDINVTDFDGRTITLGGFRGQPVVVNFFESW